MNINIKAHLRLLLIVLVPILTILFVGGHFHAAIFGEYSEFYTDEVIITLNGQLPLTQMDFIEIIITLIMMGLGIANGVYYLVILIKSRKEPVKTIMLCCCLPLFGISVFLGVLGLIPAVIADIYYIVKHKRYNFFIVFLKVGSVYN